MAENKYLDKEGLKHFSKVLSNYPDNTILSAVIDAISEMITETGNNSNAYTDNKINDTKTTRVPIALPASGWTGSGPYTQSVTIDGLLENQYVRVYPAYGDNDSANIDMASACACVNYAKRNGTTITFTCLNDKPTSDINAVVDVYV